MISRLHRPDPTALGSDYFDRDAQDLARQLLGKILRVKQTSVWLMARIIETEAYYLQDKASHASLGHTLKRQALFAEPGTIYMYYARGGDSLNFSARGAGNAVLIKAAYPVSADPDHDSLLQMQINNPQANGTPRPADRLCSGQTLLCRALGLTVPDWDNKTLDPSRFQVADDGYEPAKIIQTTRLGIRPERDAQLPYRFIDFEFRRFCSKDPTRVRNFQMGRDYIILAP